MPRRVMPWGLLIAVLAVALGAAPADATKYAAEFLRIGAGARALGMGGAVTACVDDASSVYWNPAGMVMVERAEVALMHSEQFGDLADYDFASYVQQLPGTGSVGVGIVRFSVDDILITQGAYDDENGNHKYDWGERIDPSRFYLDSDTEYALFFSFARAMNRMPVVLGGTLKLVRQDMPGHSSFGIGTDLGARWSPRPDFQLGARFSDITTTQLYWDTGRRETVSPSLFVGGAYSRSLAASQIELLLTCDFALTFDGRETASSFSIGIPSVTPDMQSRTFFWGDAAVGIEAWYRKLFAARAGWQESGVTAGAGLRIAGFGVDYAFVPHEALGSSHRLSASYAF